VIAVYDEKIVTTGTSLGKLFIFIIELYKDHYSVNKALNLGPSDGFAIHSLECFDGSVYMADSYNNKIYKFDGRNNFFETNVGRDPRHMCRDKDNIYVANFESDNISIIDYDTFTLTGLIPAGIKAHDVKYSEIYKSLYVSCYEENEVAEYNLDTGKTRRFKTDGKPMHIYLLEDTLIVMTYYVNGDVQTRINISFFQNENIKSLIEEKTQIYVEELLDKLKEYGFEMKINPTIFVGGGSMLLQKYIENSPKIGYMEVLDSFANVKGFELLAKQAVSRDR
jgi:hypothetical protein